MVSSFPIAELRLVGAHVGSTRLYWEIGYEEYKRTALVLVPRPR